MPIKHLEEYREPEICRKLAETIRQLSTKPVRLMEVCGTHTMSIFQNGIRDLLPDSISLLSGPGCPVCVTAQNEIDAFIALSRPQDVIVATFGDLMRVPGTESSLQKERARGGDIRVVYSAYDAVEMAKDHPGKKVVFLGVGFETTAPTIAASVLSARERGIGNFSVFSAHKLVPPALCALMETPGLQIHGLILPGHVSVILGEKAYFPFVERYRVPCAIAGFEPVDILQAICSLVRQFESFDPRLENCYPRAVTRDGNEKAVRVMEKVFRTVDTVWRGLGTIPQSGLSVREEFEEWDAAKVFDLPSPPSEERKGCSCGEILTGKKIPPECPLYKKICTPADPYGPCMVSNEGTCAAYYRYHTA